jgi:hypothetical protein
MDSIQDIVMSQLKGRSAKGGDKRLNRFMLRLRSVGIVEGRTLEGARKRYLLIDAKSWDSACQVCDTKEAYTYNRMVNRLSHFQSSRMLRQSLGTLDEATVKAVFGIKSIQYRLASALLKALDPKVVRAVDDGLMSRRCAAELTYVGCDRQREILRHMAKNKDYSISFARAMIIKTPARQRNRNKRQRKPWTGGAEKKQELVAKLEEIEKRYDFYASLYRQYSADLLKLCIYARRLLTNEPIRAYLEERHPEILKCFESIVFETGKVEAA